MNRDRRVAFDLANGHWAALFDAASEEELVRLEQLHEPRNVLSLEEAGARFQEVMDMLRAIVKRLGGKDEERWLN